jgi:hypothetical protein
MVQPMLAGTGPAMILNLFPLRQSVAGPQVINGDVRGLGPFLGFTMTRRCFSSAFGSYLLQEESAQWRKNFMKLREKYTLREICGTLTPTKIIRP